MNFKQRLTKIKTFMFDVDGVLTDGKVLVMLSGEMVRNMNSKDGYALQLAVKKKYRLVIISGGNNVAVKQTLEKTVSALSALDGSVLDYHGNYG